ncbi:hypothetical protein ABEW32_18540 [Paenibacillus jamilae]
MHELLQRGTERNSRLKRAKNTHDCAYDFLILYMDEKVTVIELENGIPSC